MKVLILAGGYGTRMSEETDIRPKPMVEIGGRPIIWHIMKTYSYFGYNEFIILLGYKGYYIKEYFANYFLHQSDVTIDLKTNEMEIHRNLSAPWKVTLLDTGRDTMTGGRIKRAKEFIGNDPFMLTYGDGVADVNIKELVEFHQKGGQKLTMTAIQPDGRYGALDFDNNNLVKQFVEKPKGDNAWINGGFFVCQPEVLDYIDGDKCVFERKPMETLAKEKQLFAYQHDSFWKCMDTLRDKKQLNEMWNTNQAKWKLW